MTLGKWFLDLFKDERGSVSIKPVIALMGSVFLCAAMLVSVLNVNSLIPADNLVDAVMFITITGMGADTLDKFSTKALIETKSRTKTKPRARTAAKK